MVIVGEKCVNMKEGGGFIITWSLGVRRWIWSHISLSIRCV